MYMCIRDMHGKLEIGNLGMPSLHGIPMGIGTKLLKLMGKGQDCE